MSRKLRCLVVEDQEDDALLLVRELKRSGYELEWERVDAADTLSQSLTKGWDIVISDYAMPGFGAVEALRIVQSAGVDLPFIIVSGTIGEETAVGCMKAGAHDFLLKGQLARLSAAIDREIRAARDRAAQRAEEARARDLEIARLEAERQSRFKSQFLAVMSHELRTPLTAIMGFAELMGGDDLAHALAPRQRDYVSNILTSAKHLLTLANDVLDLSYIEAGKLTLHLEWVNLVPAIAAKREVFAPQAEKQQVSLAIDVPEALPRIIADPVRVEQILLNLISNALKFTPPGGSVRVSASVRPKHIAIAVRDTGIGIRREDMHRLFREFERIETKPGHRAPGSGLGLSLTKRLVEAHGGRISVESAPEVGSTFTVELPLSLTGESPPPFPK